MSETVEQVMKYFSEPEHYEFVVFSDSADKVQLDGHFSKADLLRIAASMKDAE